MRQETRFFVDDRQRIMRLDAEVKRLHRAIEALGLVFENHRHHVDSDEWLQTVTSGTPFEYGIASKEGT